ncbi:unnamed protein product, partial [Effrenium voratum]
DAANTLEVTSPDGNRQSLDKELLREFPWLERLWQGHRLSDSSTGADLLAAASAEWEKLQLYSKYYLAEKQQQQTRAAFAPESLQADLDAHLDKLLAAVGELTGETMEQLRPKYSREREELKAFAHLVQKTLATKAAAEKMRETQQTAKAQAKQQAAKDKVEAMDLNQVVAASVTQSLLQVLPTCGVQVPKKVQASLAAAATKPVAESNVREAVLQGLLAQDQGRRLGLACLPESLAVTLAAQTQRSALKRAERQHARSQAWRARPRLRRRRQYLNTLTSAQLQLRFAWQLLKGSRWNLVAAFAKQKAELDQQVVVYSSDLRAVDPQAEVPWPVKLLLTMRGSKFLFGGTLPSEQRVRQGRRLRTGAMLGTGGGSYNHELYCPNEAWQPRRCSGPAEASMDAFEEEVARRLGEEQARLAAAKQRGNWTPLDCLAFQKMKQLGWSAVKSDKDSSFVLLKVSDREAELRRLLRDPEHFELAATTPAELFRLDRTVLAAYKAAVGEVLRCEAWTDLAGGRERLQRFLLSRAKPPYSFWPGVPLGSFKTELNSSEGSKQRGNFTPVDCLGFQLMKKLGWSAVKSDKDSSFVLLRVADRQTELRRLLEDEVHFELAASTPHALLRLSEEVRRNFKTAVGGVLACPEWARLAGGRERLERFLLQRDKPGFTCTSKLEFNLKTHKRPIVPRELEGSQKNFLQPAQKFASHVLRRELGPLAPWVVQDSAEFVRRAEAGEFVVPPNYALYSGDIKEFFPSCEHDGLAAAQERLLLARGYSIRAATAFKNLAVLLLNSQYAYAPEVEGS